MYSINSRRGRKHDLSKETALEEPEGGVCGLLLASAISCVMLSLPLRY